MNVKPRWIERVPLCCEACPQHDGKRCRALGAQPETVCVPVVRAMTTALEELDQCDDVGQAVRMTREVLRTKEAT